MAGRSLPHDQQAIRAGVPESDGEHRAVLRAGGGGGVEAHQWGGGVIHELNPSRATLHGHWSRELPPAISIDGGDTVRFACLDAMWCAGRPGAWPWKRYEPRAPELDDGHALTGPVFVRGAKPGMTLEVSIGAIVPDTWAWTWSWPQSERAAELGLADAPNYVQVWDVDPERMLERDGEGRALKLRPFTGVMGFAPAEAGAHSRRP